MNTSTGRCSQEQPYRSLLSSENTSAVVPDARCERVAACPPPRPEPRPAVEAQGQGRKTNDVVRMQQDRTARRNRKGSSNKMVCPLDAEGGRHKLRASGERA